MDFKKTNALLTIIIFFSFAPMVVTGGRQENSLVKAIKLFEEKKYKEAEPLLQNLISEKPEHLMINYYYGACRTENNQYGLKEVICLLKGSTGEAPLKTDYYLGIQYHAQSRWEDALKHYNYYSSKANPKEQENVLLSEKIQQCLNKINPFAIPAKCDTTDILPTALPRKQESETFSPVISDNLLTNQDSTFISDTIVSSANKVTRDRPAKDTPVTEPISFVVNGEITYLDKSHFQTTRGLDNYNNWYIKQKELKSKQAEADGLRDSYASAQSDDEKQKIGQKILDIESDTYGLQDETNQFFILAQTAENEYWQNAPADEKENFRKKLDTFLKKDSENKSTSSSTDSVDFTIPPVLLTGADNQPVTEEDSKDELVYKIQLGAYSRGLPTYVKRLFKKLSYIRKIENYTDEKGVVVYTTGNLTSYEDALKMKEQVRQEGVEDAFVVPYFNGKRITLKKAKKIEADR